MAIHLLSLPQPPPNPTSSTPDVDLAGMPVDHAAVTKFRNASSLLGRERTPHARFRRGPIATPASESATKVYDVTPIQQIPSPLPQPPPTTMMPLQVQIPLGLHEIAHLSSRRQLARIAQAGRVVSSGRGFKIMSSSLSFKRKSSSGNCGSGSSTGKCHCTNKRKMMGKRVVRVPAISLKMADIPQDEHSWRKYGQKPIKGSPHPRGYYKCSSVRGCPARKHVERAVDDQSILVITYDGEHDHSPSTASGSISVILESS